MDNSEIFRLAAEYKEFIIDSDFGFKGVEPWYIQTAVENGGFIGSENPLLGHIRRFSYFANTQLGLARAIQTATYYARKRRIEEELPNQSQQLLQVHDGEYLISNTVPEEIAINIRKIVETMFQESRGLLIILNATATDLALEVTQNFEVADQDGFQLVLKGDSILLPLSIVDRIICLGPHDYQQIERHNIFQLIKGY